MTKTWPNKALQAAPGAASSGLIFSFFMAIFLPPPVGLRFHGAPDLWAKKLTLATALFHA